MSNNALQELGTLGQSLWLDYIRRDLMATGELQRLINEDGLRGMTSNPSIFEQAIAGSHDYDEDIRTLVGKGKDVKAIYEALSQKDVQDAADLFRPLYDESEAKDGYVSLEVNPHLAHDTAGSIAEGRRLWVALDRPNVLIKIPGTAEGLLAIQQLISEGINVNVTLLFGILRYQEVAETYLSGIEKRLAEGGSVAGVASVASFFVSRIDALIDPILEKVSTQGGLNQALAQQAHGKVAIASAREAYQAYLEIFESTRFRHLQDRGASHQRLLWASTSTKDPNYSNVKYIEALIGPDTVDTVPLESLHDYLEHGDPKDRLTDDLDWAGWTLDRLPELKIDLDALTQQLEDEGVAKFSESFDSLMRTLAAKARN